MCTLASRDIPVITCLSVVINSLSQVGESVVSLYRLVYSYVCVENSLENMDTLQPCSCYCVHMYLTVNKEVSQMLGTQNIPRLVGVQAYLGYDKYFC